MIVVLTGAATSTTSNAVRRRKHYSQPGDVNWLGKVLSESCIQRVLAILVGAKCSESHCGDGGPPPAKRPYQLISIAVR